MSLWERAAPALACLTGRDRALLRVLRDLRYLTVEQAHRSCYPGLTLSSVRARLGELRRRGLLARFRRDAFSDRRVFWSLASLGRAAAAALKDAGGGGAAGGGAGAGGTQRAAAMAALQIDHVIGTNGLYCDLCEAVRMGGLPPLRWLAGFRAVVDLGHTHLVPDAVVLAAGPETGWWTYYVERDRGTMPVGAMREKLERYAVLFRLAGVQSGQPAWHPRADAWLLLACDDNRRAARLASLAADVRLERAWAGTAGACAAGLAASLRNLTTPRECPPLPVWADAALAVPEINSAVEEAPR